MTEIIDFFAPSTRNGIFSNFYPKLAPITYRGKEFATSEHAYQWAKFSYDGADDATRAYAELVRAARTPNQSRVLAKQKVGGGYVWRTALNGTITQSHVDGVKADPNWERNKVGIMREVLAIKFQQPLAMSRLLETGEAALREASPYDSFWGIGSDGKGENWLGKLLMELRTTLRAEKLTFQSVVESVAEYQTRVKRSLEQLDEERERKARK